jgi:hypothetical protein
MRPTKRIHISSTIQKALSQVELNASEASRTITVDVRDVNTLAVKVNMTARSAATSLVITPTASLDEGVTYLAMCTTAAAAAQDVRTFSISTAGGFVTQFDVKSYDFVKLVISGASGGASDVVDAYVSGS